MRQLGVRRPKTKVNCSPKAGLGHLTPAQAERHRKAPRAKATSPRTVGATELSRRLIDAAKERGIPEADLQAEIGDISDYIASQLKAVSRAESERHKPT
ncbi:hypothetical protein ACVW1C_002572 [Bradyrhizobium sp. USDA 4011]